MVVKVLFWVFLNFVNKNQSFEEVDKEKNGN